MGYTFDYFVGTLQCPVCGTVSAADASTNMQTYIRAAPELAYLGVGHPLIIEPEAMADRGYLTIRRPLPGVPIRILQTWECPTCGAPFNWAEITVGAGTIEHIEAVSLTRKVVEKAHYISNEVISVVAELTGRSFADLRGTDLVQLLREYL